MKTSILLICALLVIGCAPKKPEAIDPCATAPTVCWGNRGTNISENAVCAELVKCFDWEMKVR
jgi:hypothetical protein